MTDVAPGLRRNRLVRPGALACVLLLAACKKSPEKQTHGPEPVTKVAPAEGRGRATEPQVGPNPSGAPVETAPPNVPEFQPAFAGQTRAPAIHSKTKFVVKEITSDLKQPWAIAFLPDRRMLVTQKHEGSLLVVTPDGRKSPAVAGVPRVVGEGQAGLLDVEVAPDFATSRFVYLSYVEPREGGNGLAVARARFVDGAPAKLEGLQIVFRAEPTLDSDKHAGGRLVFGAEGHLFVALGERSIRAGRVQARDPKSHLGKIVRILPDGAVPKDNPFIGRDGARPEIWSSGHRNPLGAAFDARQRLWVAEMGPRGGDELNLVEKGKDYGWPTIGYGEEYSGDAVHEKTQAPGLEQPVYYWDPVVSPGALAIYDGDLFPEWKGNFFVAALSGQALVRVALENDRVIGEERLLTDRNERLREVTQGPDGALYLLTDGKSGKLLRIAPK